MKPFFSTLIVFLILIAVSCKKDTIQVSQPPCNTCSSASQDSLTLGPLFLQDSNWVRQADGTYKSDVTALILQGGGSISQLYSMEILSEGNLFQIYPNFHVKLFGGEFYGSVNKYYDNEICTVTYSYSDQNKYFGESPNGGQLPFHSIVIRALLVK